MSDGSGPVVIKAFALVEAVLAANRALSLTELSEAVGRPKQTVHRTARQLEEHGFLYREPTRERYAIGPKLFRVSKDVLGWYTRYAPRSVLLTKLVEEVSETCNIGILDGDRVLYLDRVESNFPLRAELHPGSRVPIHCTGLGKLLLAHLPARTQKRVIERLDLDRYTDQTITTSKGLLDDCAATLERGYSLNNQEYHDGIISVSVPICASDSEQVVAGLALHAPAARLNIDAAIELVPTLKTYAVKLADDFADKDAN